MKKHPMTLIGVVLIVVLAAFFVYASKQSAPGADKHGTAAEEPESAASAQGEESSEAKKVRIGILQLMSHPSLDQIHQGIIDGLKARGYENGKNVEIEDLNGQGEQSNLKMMSDQLVADQSDYLVAIATPSAQALSTAAQGRIPMIMSAVTDPVGAGLVDSMENPGKPVTGTSDALPVAEQIDLLRAFVPGAKTIGLLYTTSEPASAAQIAEAKEAVEKAGLKAVEASIASTNDLAQVAETLAGDVDAIYVPNDNTIAASMNTLIAATNAHRIPVIASAEAMVASGALASRGVVQYQIGIDTANMLADVMEGKDPSTMPVQLSIKAEIYVNVAQAEQLGIAIPDEVRNQMKDVSSETPEQ